MVKVYSSKNCSYCDKLKKGLNDLGIEFTEIDINEDKESADKIFKFVKVEVVPIIIVNKQVLVPSRGFNTIDQAINLIKSLV